MFRTGALFFAGAFISAGWNCAAVSALFLVAGWGRGFIFALFRFLLLFVAALLTLGHLVPPIVSVGSPGKRGEIDHCQLLVA